MAKEEKTWKASVNTAMKTMAAFTLRQLHFGVIVSLLRRRTNVRNVSYFHFTTRCANLQLDLQLFTSVSSICQIVYGAEVTQNWSIDILNCLKALWNNLVVAFFSLHRKTAEKIMEKYCCCHQYLRSYCFDHCHSCVFSLQTVSTPRY